MTGRYSPATWPQRTKIAELLGRSHPGYSWPQVKALVRARYDLDVDTMTMESASGLIQRLEGRTTHPWRGSEFNRRRSA